MWLTSLPFWVNIQLPPFLDSQPVHFTCHPVLFLGLVWCAMQCGMTSKKLLSKLSVQKMSPPMPSCALSTTTTCRASKQSTPMSMSLRTSTACTMVQSKLPCKWSLPLHWSQASHCDTHSHSWLHHKCILLKHCTPTDACHCACCNAISTTPTMPLPMACNVARYSHGHWHPPCKASPTHMLLLQRRQPFWMGLPHWIWHSPFVPGWGW